MDENKREGGGYDLDTWGASRSCVGRAVVVDELTAWAAHAVNHAEKQADFAPPSADWWEGYAAGLRAAAMWAAKHGGPVGILQFQ